MTEFASNTEFRDGWEYMQFRHILGLVDGVRAERMPRQKVQAFQLSERLRQSAFTF